ncbi:MAG: hypothetical protein Q9159_002265 [Coniocarpon cinnabarinum]
MSTAKEYLLKRDFNASSRLTAQHLLWKDALGFTIHPDIPIPPAARVADIATGNGVWLLDVSREYSGRIHQLDGFDISLDQCPHEQSLPPSVRFHEWNFFDAPPPQFIEAFDVVHIRLITFVIKDNNPMPVLENICQLLKPGGCLQWDEVDNMRSCVQTYCEKIPMLYKCLGQLSGWIKIPQWKETLVDQMKHIPYLEDGKFSTYEYDSVTARLWTDLYLSTWNEYATGAINDPEEVKSLGGGAMDEVRAGASIRMPMIVWTVRKRVITKTQDVGAAIHDDAIGVPPMM